MVGNCKIAHSGVCNVKEFADPRFGQQEKVNAYFRSQSLFWKDLYASSGVYAEIHRDRHAAVFDWIDGLALAPGSQVLEIGCGAGFMAVAPAQRGCCVHLVNSLGPMVDRPRRLAAETGPAALLPLGV